MYKTFILNGQVYAINDAGQSVGDSVTTSGGDDAVLWSPTGKATVRQDVGGQGFSEAVAINDSGQSVGVSYTASSVDAVLWSPSGKATVLQDVGGEGAQAFAINDFGWSVGLSVAARGSGAIAEAVLWCQQGTQRCSRTWARATAPPSPSTMPGRALDIPARTRCCGRRRGRRRCCRMWVTAMSYPSPLTTPDRRWRFSGHDRQRH